tara:strand:- start:322 stop:504 length:183 start_codon:yes stop_codon:yes gene_type:complete
MNKGAKMYTQTQTDTKVLEAKVELMERFNKLLELMNIMQDNMTLMAKRIKELESNATTRI